MHTKDKLARALRQAGLEEMASRAEAGYYHDFMSPLPFPEMELHKDLTEAGTPAALALRELHVKGEFDASMDESTEWFDSAEGRETFAQLTRSGKK